MDYFLFIKSVLDDIENRVTEDLTAGEVAAVAGFSTPHFREVFRNTTGRTLAKYITHRRLCHAASALARTGRSVSEIAMDYGFGSHDVFTRAFRRTFHETPANFRAHGRSIRGTLIVPGIFGPSVETQEDLKVMKETGNQEHVSVGTLYGVVPKVAYSEVECTPFPSCLRACLTYLGQNADYKRLLAGSGAAFRLMWNPECWDGGNVDIMLMREDPTEPLRRAFWTAGRDFRLLCKPGQAGHYLAEMALRDDSRIGTGDKEEFVALIKREIDAGRPLIGFGIIGPPEACIIAGYRDEGETLVGWNFFQEMPEFAGAIEKEPCGYFRRRGWYEHPETIAVMAVGEQVDIPEERKFLRDTLEFALQVMETPRMRNYAGGFAAYKAWASALEQEGEFPKEAPLPLLMERLMCQCDAMTMVGEGRAYAAAFLGQEAGVFPEAAQALKQAADSFRHENSLVREMAGLLEGYCMGEKQARNLGRPEIRRDLAVLIRQCAQADRKAADAIKQALERVRNI